MSPKSAYDISPDATFADAARAALRHQLHELMDNLPGTRQGDDIEALHDMRVASRRLRAALSVFAAAFPPKDFRPLEKKAAQITDALGAVRDADVQIEFMQSKADTAPAHLKVGLEAFVEHLKQERDRERVHLVKALDALEKGRFRRDFLQMLGEDMAPSPTPPPADGERGKKHPLAPLSLSEGGRAGGGGKSHG